MICHVPLLPDLLTDVILLSRTSTSLILFLFSSALCLCYYHIFLCTYHMPLKSDDRDRTTWSAQVTKGGIIKTEQLSQISQAGANNLSSRGGAAEAEL